MRNYSVEQIIAAVNEYGSTNYQSLTFYPIGELKEWIKTLKNLPHDVRMSPKKIGIEIRASIKALSEAIWSKERYYFNPGYRNRMSKELEKFHFPDEVKSSPLTSRDIDEMYVKAVKMVGEDFDDSGYTVVLKDMERAKMMETARRRKEKLRDVFYLVIGSDIEFLSIWWDNNYPMALRILDDEKKRLNYITTAISQLKNSDVDEGIEELEDERERVRNNMKALRKFCEILKEENERNKRRHEKERVQRPA